VADAKAFRLSRTAKNQKDFKVGALSTWRKDADYAVLVGPLFQYPSSTSQIYLQAAHNDVCLLSFAHLVALMRLDLPDPDSFEPLWAASKSLGESTKSAATYWNHLNRAFSGLSRKARDTLHTSLQDEMTGLEHVRRTEISTLENIAKRVKEMTREEAVTKLLASLKLESRIGVIKAVSAGQLYRLVDPQK
jgi:type II restriction enzyme